MGFFRNNNRSNSTAAANKDGAADTTNESSLVALLKAKIAQLEEKVERKDEALESLQKRLQGDLRHLTKMDDASTLTIDTLSLSESQSCNSDSTGLRSREDHPLVTRLTTELEDKNAQVASLQLQLEEQKTLATHLQERLHMSEQGKATLVSQISALELKLFDQTNQIDCLQSLNATNCDIVADLEAMHGTPKGANARRASSGNISYTAGSGSQWKMYQKLESLMSSNTKIAQQLSAASREKQEALKKVAKLEMDQKNLEEQVDALTEQLHEKDHKLTQMQLETDCDFSTSTGEDAQPTVIPQIQQVLDIFASSSADSEEAEENVQDPKLLKLSLQVAQSQLKQIQKDHELQLQKTVRQSVQLAETRAKVDTLNAKVEHYETLMDQVLAKTPAFTTNNNSQMTPVASTNTSKAARMVMANDQDDGKIPLGIPSARRYQKGPNRSLPGLQKLFGRQPRVEMEC